MSEEKRGFTVEEALVLQRAAEQRVVLDSIVIKDGVVAHVESMGDDCLPPFRVVSGDHVGDWFEEMPSPRIRNGKVWYVGCGNYETGVSCVVDGMETRSYAEIPLHREVEGVMYVVVKFGQDHFKLLQEGEPIAEFGETGPCEVVDGRFYLAGKQCGQEMWGIFRAEQGHCSSLQLPPVTAKIREFAIDGHDVAAVCGEDDDLGVIAFGREFRFGKLHRVAKARFEGAGDTFRILVRTGRVWREITRTGVREIADPDAGNRAIILTREDLEKMERTEA